MFKRVLHTKSLTLSAAYDASKTLGYTSDYGASVLPEFFKSQHIAFGASPADFMKRTAVTLLQNWEKFRSFEDIEDKFTICIFRSMGSSHFCQQTEASRRQVDSAGDVRR